MREITNTAAARYKTLLPILPKAEMIIEIKVPETLAIDESVLECFNILKEENDELFVNSSVPPDYRIVVEEDASLFSVGIGSLGISYRTGELSDVLSEVLGMLLGYQRAVAEGFTVRNREGRKIKPKAPLFIRSTFHFPMPHSLCYLKEKVDAPAIPTMSSASCKTASRILRSVVKAGAMKFSSGESEFVLYSAGDGIYIYSSTTMVVPVLRRSLVLMNSHAFIEFLERQKFWFTRTLVTAYTSVESGEIMKKVRECLRAMTEKPKASEVSCIREIVNVAPRFGDHRDRITGKLRLFCEYNALPAKHKGEKEYLSIRQVSIIDRCPIGSLKRYSRT
jgi:hypothetical protein